MSSSDDIHLSADGQINQFAGDSINLCTQRNLVAHVSGKVSLFAAQNGIKQVAAKGKFDMHAQGDGMDLLAKQGIKIISTEDRIEITSPKEILITAGSSQLKLNGSGIFPTTGGKFEVKAGQHLLKSGENAHATIPLMPKLGSHKIQFELRDTETQALLPFTSYMLMNDQGHVSYGKTDANSLTQAFVTDKQENYYLHAINDKIKKLDN